MDNLNCLGLTGGIASGKSYVSRLFAGLGVAIVDTDEIARTVVAPGSKGLSELSAAFGDEILADDGSLKRDRLRALVFADATGAARAQLERITHPKIRAEVQRQIHQLQQTEAHYALVAIPLLISTTGEKSPHYDFLAAVVVVDCTQETQLRRLCARDEIALELAQKMMQAQASRAQRLAHATHVISNDDGADTVSVVQRLHQRLLSNHTAISTQF